MFSRPSRTELRRAPGPFRRLGYSLAALVVAAPLSVVALNALTDDQPFVFADAIEPVSATVDSVPLADGANVSVPDAAIATQSVGDPDDPLRGVVKELHRDEPFSMFAITWEGERDVTAYFRALQADGSWGPWHDADSTQGTVSGTAVNGTEPIYLEPTTAVQVSTLGLDVYGTPEALDETPAAAPESAATTEYSAEADTAIPAPAAADAPAEEAPAVAPAAEQPSSGPAPIPTNYGDIRPVADEDTPGMGNDLTVSAVFIDGNAEADSGTGSLAPAADVTGRPVVLSRASWGADESIRCRNATYDDSIAATVVHHTAGSNNYSRSEAAGIVRGIYKYHAQTLGWCDIGYQSLVDKYGTIYEGRYGGLDRNVQGAHAGGFNGNTWAVSMMGDYSNISPSAATLDSVAQLLGWRMAVAGVDPTGSGTHYSEGTSYTKYAYGTAVTLPNIFAHRDVGLTACPGNVGYTHMGEIRTKAKTYYDAARSGTSASAPTSQASPTTTSGAAATTSAAAVTTPATTTAAPVTPVNPTPVAADTGSALGGGTVRTVGDVNLLGTKLSDIPVLVTQVLNLFGDHPFAQAWRSLAGPITQLLGLPLSGVQYGGLVDNSQGGFDLAQIVKFDGGVMASSPETGIQALWGAIADAWAAQGFETGPLGLPLNEEYTLDNGLIRVDFQHGTITYDPATNTTTVERTE